MNCKSFAKLEPKTHHPFKAFNYQAIVFWFNNVTLDELSIKIKFTFSFSKGLKFQARINGTSTLLKVHAYLICSKGNHYLQDNFLLEHI